MCYIKAYVTIKTTGNYNKYVCFGRCIHFDLRYFSLKIMTGETFGHISTYCAQNPVRNNTVKVWLTISWIVAIVFN